MKSTKNATKKISLQSLLHTAVLAGVLSGTAALADEHTPPATDATHEATEKQSCKGEKASCNGQTKKNKAGKNSCGGANGCGQQKKKGH